MARLGFNDLTGFMVAWNLWLLGITVMAGTGLIVATNLSYAIGPSAAWMPGSKWFVSLINCVLVVALVLVTLRGLALGKWIHNAGAVMLMVIYAALIIIPFVSPARLAAGSYHPLAIAMPAVHFLALTFLARWRLAR